MKKKVALLVRLEAKPGKEKEVADFLRSGLALVQEEPDTITWYGVQFGPSSFGIFDTFPHDEGRKSHLAGKVGQALMANAPNLLAKDPEIVYTDILAVKSEDVLDAKKA
ncbi:MAG: antibiotic biosynthesis monooxygenase [Niastella sp.]|nr:antibiotic biosynthesis monooxygenase [Niastella sp.]